MKPLRARSAVVLSIAALAAMLAACGSSGKSSKAAAPKATPAAASVQLLTAADVNKERKGTPERTVLEWWRSMQYGDATGAADAYASAAHVTSKTLLVQLQKVDGFFRRHPVIQDSTRHGARATVYLVARGLSQDKSGHSIRTEQPLALTLVRQGGNWLLADNLLVQQVAGSHP